MKSFTVKKNRDYLITEDYKDCKTVTGECYDCKTKTSCLLVKEQLSLYGYFDKKELMDKINLKTNSLSNIKPIQHSIEAKSHSPVYRMHRYFARRPYNVFNYLISHYSREGDIILDPFCGGGTTVVEGLRLRRKVVGVDLNPMATFITRSEIMDLNLEEIKRTFNVIKTEVLNEIKQLYKTLCPRCKKSAELIWVEWSNVFICPSCDDKNIASDSQKLRPGKYKCKKCRKDFLTSDASRDKDVVINSFVACDNCGYKGKNIPSPFDIALIEKIEKDFDRVVKERKLWYPKDKMPQGYDLRRPYNQRIERFCDFLTKRNLLISSILFKSINQIKDKRVRYFILNIFTSTLAWITKMSVDTGHGWAIHAYWMPNRYYELNVWDQFEKRFQWGLRGKTYSNKEIGSYYKEATNFEDLKKEATTLLLNQSSTKLPLPDNSVAAIITDPPYGGNVMYSELCNFWTVWLKDLFGIKGLIDNREEAIKNDYQKKGDREYEDLLFNIFKECHRVLKPNGWMVMTFNNKESSVWVALLRAAKRAGFFLPDAGIVYQEPIEHYTNTLYQRRHGSLLGDFIYSFQKKNKGYSSSKNGHNNGKNIKKIILGMAEKIISQKKSVTTSEVYQALIPSLFKYGIFELENILIPDIEGVLKRKFRYEKFNGTRKWCL